MLPQEEEADQGRHGQADAARSTGAALEAHCRFVLWLVPAEGWPQPAWRFVVYVG